MSFFHKPKFRRVLGGYKKKDVDEFLLRTEQECDLFEDNYEKRIALLVQENEQAAQMIRILQENEARLSSDNEEYRKQLKDNKSMLQTLTGRLDSLGKEAEQLQAELKRLRKTVNSGEPDTEEWKQRALSAEETVRKFAEAELQANAERENGHHIRVPLGKKSYLDFKFRKDAKNI
jgi:DivIVA domain-containing protein